MEENKYLVRVSCMTYNHAPYIEDAMNGFTMQETTFPFVCTIVDDCSTDGEQEVIKKYLDDHFDMDDTSVVRKEDHEDYTLTFARHKTNQNCYFAVLFLKYNHYKKKSKAPYLKEWTNSKYTALCEGDDYWIKPEKLQIQVDYLEYHPDCGMVYTAYRTIYQDSSISRDIYSNPKILYDDNYKWRILEQNVAIGTPTVLIRESLKKTIATFKEDFRGFKMSDIQIWFHAARLSSIGYIPTIASVYRKHYNGATAYMDNDRRYTFLKSCLDVHLHMAKKYGAPQTTIKIIKYKFGGSLLDICLKQSDYSTAKSVIKECFGDNLFLLFFISQSVALRQKKLGIFGRIIAIIVYIMIPKPHVSQKRLEHDYMHSLPKGEK